MTNEQLYANHFKKLLDEREEKYSSKGEQLLYEQGVLLGILATLAIYDSKNTDHITKALKKNMDRPGGIEPPS